MVIRSLLKSAPKLGLKFALWQRLEGVPGWLLCWLSQIIKCNIGSARPAVLPSYTITPRNSPTFGTQIPIRYNSDHKLAEEIVSKAAQRHTLSFQDLTE